MNSEETAFRDKLEHTSDFVITFELIPGRASRGRNLENVLEFARQAAADGVLDGLTLTDNPGGSPSLSPDELGREIASMGIPAMIHLTCRDSNRSGVYSRVLQLDRMGIRNLLVLTGDYPAEVPSGIGKPGFDLDSVSALCLIRKLNHAGEPFCMRKDSKTPVRTHFFAGCAVSCYKYSEAEQFAQYYKLLRKLRHDARFVITQLCFDARKFHELIQFLRAASCKVPVIGTAYMLTKPAAGFMNKGNVPGAPVTDKLYRQIAEEAQAEDGGLSACIERTAKLLAVLRGIGYRGAHIGGRPVYRDVKKVIDRFHDIKSDWQSFLSEFDFPYDDGFYLYQKDHGTGLNAAIPSPREPSSMKYQIPMTCFEAFHKTVFCDGQKLYPALKRCAEWTEKHRGPKVLYELAENMSKRILFDCRKCGDCALAEMAYLCPESQCPKFMRNGPCGGSDKTRCEVFKERPCVWVRVYERLKCGGRETEINERCVPPRNWALNQTSSWLNFYQGRDHHRIGNGRDCLS